MSDPSPAPAAPGPLERLLQRCKTDRRIVLLLMVPNLVGIVFGYYYYWKVGQFDLRCPPPAPCLARTVAWWPFISDSPNAVVLMSAALLLYAFGGRRFPVLDHLAFTSMVYVGAWTTFLFTSYPDQLGSFDLGSNNNILFVSHMGMPLEALVLLPDLRRDWTRWTVGLGVGAWQLLNLWLDYWGPHLHPAPFLHDFRNPPPLASASDQLLHAGSPWIMAATLALWLAVAKPWRRGPRSPWPAVDGAESASDTSPGASSDPLEPRNAARIAAGRLEGA